MGENTEQTTNRKTETTAQMNELNKALLELKKITGISLEVSGAAPEQIEPALTQIHCLCTAYKEKYNRTDFLQGLMTGNIPHYEISDRASRLHIDPEEKRILFLIEGKHFDETSGAILKNLLSCRSKTYIVPLTETLLAVIRPLCQNETFEDMRHIAETIVDTLNTEALIRVRLSYSSVMNTLADIQKAFQETNLALKVGRLFYSEQNIFPYNELGIGRLIYRLPVSLCENFLSEIFGSPIPKTLDPELMATVNRFFLNNLNIAETARQLHMHRNTLIYRLEQIEKQLAKLEDVIDIKKLQDGESVCRELILVKIKINDTQRQAVLSVANIFRAKIVDVSNDSMVIELTGGQSKLDAFLDLLRGYDILELARTGITGLSRGSSNVTIID